MSHLPIVLAGAAAVIGNYALDRQRVKNRRFREAAYASTPSGPSGFSIATRIKTDPNDPLSRPLP